MYTVYDVCVCVCSVCVMCVCLRAHVIVVNIVLVGASVPLAGRKVQPSRQLGSLTVGSALHCWLSGYADVNPFIGERAKRARHSQVFSIENRGYIYYI